MSIAKQTPPQYTDYLFHHHGNGSISGSIDDWKRYLKALEQFHSNEYSVEIYYDGCDDIVLNVETPDE